MDDICVLNILLEDNSQLYESAALQLMKVSTVIEEDFREVVLDISENTLINRNSTGVNVKHYFESLPNLSEDEYFEHFRMTRPTMKKLIDLIKQNIEPHVIQGTIVPLEKKVHVTVWALANKDSYREIGNLFGLHKSSFSMFFKEICKILSDLRFDIVKWPTADIQNITKNYVLRQHKFPNCIGFVDGCHVQILGPVRNPTDYYNRKEVHSIILQSICNEKLEFIDIHLGHTGRAHDARVFRESRISEELENLISCEDHILGDSAYTLSPRVLTPYRDNGYLTPAQRKYNQVHASARSYIERAFGRLKGKFRWLKYLELHKTEDVTQVVAATCVLHNFILKNESVTENSFAVEERVINLQNMNGTIKRNAICQFINNM